jgi:nucleotide-binding universal stress UspA family protein
MGLAAMSLVCLIVAARYFFGHFCPIHMASFIHFLEGGVMFTHILIPTDGSELSRNAGRGGIQLARALNAKVTGFFAAPEHKPDLYEDSFPIHAMSKERFFESWKSRAEIYLAALAAIAKEAGVIYQGIWSTSDYPAEAIIEAAQQNGCDLICMASHGRRVYRDCCWEARRKKS